MFRFGDIALYQALQHHALDQVTAALHHTTQVLSIMLPLKIT
jgi:hypothetical protein